MGVMGVGLEKTLGGPLSKVCKAKARFFTRIDFLRVYKHELESSR